MLGILNAGEIEQLLKEQMLGRVGCHYGDGIYVVPISYAYDGEFVYCHSHEGLKLDCMRKDPNICFEVDHLENMANWQSVIAWGEFEEVKDGPQRYQALQKLHDRVLPFAPSETVLLAQDWLFSPVDLKKVSGIVFRIRLGIKTGRFEKTLPQAFYAS